MNPFMKKSAPILAAVLALGACSQLEEEAKKQLEALSQQDATEISANCALLKTQYLQSGDSLSLATYAASCQEDFIAANMPADLSTDCQTEYKTMLETTEAKVLALRGQCDSSNVETEASCLAAKQEIETLAVAFQEKCGVSEFYYPTPEDASVPTVTVDGKCAWQAWIPQSTRTGTDSTAMLQCIETPPVCTQVILAGEARLLEIHLSVDGDTVYLPCVQELADIYAPCDLNKDRFVDPIEAKQCAEMGTISDPCDWDGNGMLDEFEKSQCTFRNDSGSVDPGAYVDPCDWNYDGKVDEYESEMCRTTYACQNGEQPYFDAMNNKTVCVPFEEIPQCEFPMYADWVNDAVVCIDPCDYDRSGIVDETEKASCQVAVGCPSTEKPFWDPITQTQLCFSAEEIPQCNENSWPELINSELTCVERCDFDRNGEVDAMEKSQCLVCPEGQAIMWDATQQINICHEPVPCEPGSYPVINEGVGTCESNGTIEPMPYDTLVAK